MTLSRTDYEYLRTVWGDLYPDDLRWGFRGQDVFAFSHETIKPEYKGPDFSYKLNSHGFRCDPFEGGSVLFNGCSATFGYAVPLESTWAHIVWREKYSELPYHNLSVPGASIDTITRLTLMYLDKYSCRGVYLYLPKFHRTEIVVATGLSNVYPNGLKSKDKTKVEVTRRLLDLYGVSPMTFAQATLRNMYAILSACSSRNIPLRVGSWDRLTYDVLEAVPMFRTTLMPYTHLEFGGGRDGTHFGVIEHRKLADSVLLSYT